MRRGGEHSSVTLAVSGDPVVGKALMLLLRGYRYDVRFLPISSLGEPDSLKGIGLLLLAPQSDAMGHEAILPAVRYIPSAAEIPTMELVTTLGETLEQRARAGSICTVPWPCSIEELKRQIEAKLAANGKL